MAGWRKFKVTLEQKPYLITLVLAGLLVLTAGLVLIGIGFKNSGEEIQIIESEATALSERSESKGKPIFVDVGGAVLRPGIYELSSGARVNDALVVSGGLAAEADRDWISQNLNLAAKLTDGGKIYIPFRDETNTSKANKDSPSLRKGESLNINTASLAELDTLWGIGPVTGQKIIDNRPYAKVEELLEKKIVKTNVYDAIKDKITVL